MKMYKGDNLKDQDKRESLPQIIVACFMFIILISSIVLLFAMLQGCSSSPQKQYEIGNDFVIETDGQGSNIKYYNCENDCYIEMKNQ